MAPKWFRKKNKADEAVQDAGQEEQQAEATDQAPGVDDLEQPPAEPATPQKKRFFFGLRRRKAESPPEEPIQEEEQPSPETTPGPSEVHATETPEQAAVESVAPKKRRFFGLRRKEPDIPPEGVSEEQPFPDQTPGPPQIIGEEPSVVEAPPEEAPKEGLFRRLRSRLSKTRQAFTSRLDNLLLGSKEIDEALLEELEEILITSDIGVQTTMALVDEVREGVKRKDLTNPDELKLALHNQILAFLQIPSRPVHLSENKPHVIMIVGVNGVGKTTTIGKLASRFVKQGRKVLLIAADTFRAAAVEQLEIWGDRAGAEVIRHKGQADPSAVAYDGMQAALARGTDVVIIDTAGRLHTKVNLMEQLKKIRRTIVRLVPDAPHEVLLVLDATTGQNAISQAQLFHEAIEITGIVLTKLDGTAKGGIVVGICHSLELPIQYIGIGEKVDDLQDFDAEAFAKALF
jgi:fused signal recognition particle receptor